jgi:phenylpyruvate tautomerase PptA (4-oxalocrotonate tautomerase family)
VPILDIELVQSNGRVPPPASLARALADAVGGVFGSLPGHTWVRLRVLPASQYAENDATLGPDQLPAFVTVLHAWPPEGEALAGEVAALTQALATGLGRAPERVHVQYAPAGAGRQAFGGKLVT